MRWYGTMEGMSERRWEYLFTCLYAAGVIGTLFTGLVAFWLVVGTLAGLWASGSAGSATIDTWRGKSDRVQDITHERIP